MYSCVCWSLCVPAMSVSHSVGKIYVGGDEEQHNSVPHAKIVDCITSCISVGNIRDILEHKKNLVNVILVFFSPGIPWTGFTTLQMTHKISLHAAVTSFVHELFHSASHIQVECMYAIKIAQNLKAAAVTTVLRKGSISPPMTFSARTRTTTIRRLLMAVTLILELVPIPPRFTLLLQSAFWK
ncbi:uncharacterized protein LOC130773837 isoform X2 [Actinidia eriantha]|uniref:uncharacterized protein LOC130773837 isoform X2 n=1 Tax=Actinidia eriantha TaxID=165200 RepID=UPI00258C424E|nr:uncharacterized protein LOC130773837 isoform X2 [Actinidia eriantha]